MDPEFTPEIAIVGAGPIGIEAALYARYLGYPVTVYENGPQVCSHVLDWGHVQLFTPFEMNSSPLGRNALEAQNPDQPLPKLDAMQTGKLWVEQYLHPLAYSDLVKKSIRTNCNVLSIGRLRNHSSANLSNGEGAEKDSRPPQFQFLIQDETGQHLTTADIVLDCSGTYGQPNWFGPASIPARGESDVRRQPPKSQLFTHSVASAEQLSQATKQGTRFAIIGAGYSAATNVVQLAKLQADQANVQCTWVTRSADGAEGPIATIENDSLPTRQNLVEEANRIATDEHWMTWKPKTEVVSIQSANGEFQLELSDGSTIVCDHVMANTGFLGDFEMHHGLQVHRCYASGGPMAWAASIIGASHDCTEQSSSGPDAMLTTEPNFFIVGSKSYGRDPRFLFAIGLQQIRDVFKIIGNRDSLDLYGSPQATTSTTW